MSHSVAGHTFDPVVHTNSYQCRDCSLVITDYALFGSVTLPPPCPGPKASAPPLQRPHAWGKTSPDPQDPCLYCGLSTYLAVASNAPCPGAPPAPQASPPFPYQKVMQAMLSGSGMIQTQWDEAPDAPPPPLAAKGPPSCPACDIELCPVIDEFAGVLGPFCARCRR
jgi:hypothetical protein